MIFGVFCFAGGGAVALCGLLNQIATKANYSPKEAGKILHSLPKLDLYSILRRYCHTLLPSLCSLPHLVGLFGSVWVGAAIFAAAVSGPFVDGTRRYKQMILAVVGPAVVLAVFFSLYMSEIFPRNVVRFDLHL